MIDKLVKGQIFQNLIKSQKIEQLMNSIFTNSPKFK